MTGVTVVGVRGHLVAVEAHVGRGLPSLILTGLPGAGVQAVHDLLRPRWALMMDIRWIGPGAVTRFPR